VTSLLPLDASLAVDSPDRHGGRPVGTGRRQASACSPPDDGASSARPAAATWAWTACSPTWTGPVRPATSRERQPGTASPGTRATGPTRTGGPQGVASLRSGALLLISWYARRTGSAGPGALASRSSTAPTRAAALPARPAGHAPGGCARSAGCPSTPAGIAVLDDLLYVADTRAGVRVFRLQDVMQVPRRSWTRCCRGPGAGTRTLGRRLTGGHTAYGCSTCCRSCCGCGSPRTERRPLATRSCSSVRSRAGSAWWSASTAQGHAPRLARYALDPTTGLPVRSAAGRYEPLAVHAGAPLRMQGVAVHDGTWYVSASAGEGNPGDLHVGRPGSLRRHRSVLRRVPRTRLVVPAGAVEPDECAGLPCGVPIDRRGGRDGRSIRLRRQHWPRAAAWLTVHRTMCVDVVGFLPCLAMT
jgi:hypothetical protein